MDSYEYYASLISESNEELYGMPAEESLNDILSTAQMIGNKLMKNPFESLMEVLETIAAKLIVLCKNLDGYKIHKLSAELVEKTIDLFENIVDDCTYTYEKILRGWSKKDVEKGVEFWNAKLLSDKNKHRDVILVANNMINKYANLLGRIKYEEKDYLTYDESVKLVKRILKMSSYLRSTSRKIQTDFLGKAKAIGMGLGNYADNLININKAEIARMGTLLISTFNHIYVRPSDNESKNNMKTTRELNKFSRDTATIVKIADMYLPDKNGAGV